jgi:hypothetical protein
MPADELTRSFNELVRQHMADDPAYAEALRREGVDTMSEGDRRGAALISPA